MARSATEESALEQARAFVRLDAWWKLHVAGADAEGWLNDLVTAEIHGIGAGEARRSFLLSPTGRIRADFTVARVSDGFLLVQDPRQPDPIGDLLERYVLSSRVDLADRSETQGLLAVPGATLPDGARGSAPSVLGEGHDLLTEPGQRGPADLAEADGDAVESWRIRRGLARFPVDLGPDSLPHEAGLDRLIPHKGCYLGQEAVAKVQMLGHPPFVVMAFAAEGAVAPGDAVRAGEEQVGSVTSAAPRASGTDLIARIRWAARGADLSAAGNPLSGGRLASGPSAG